MNYCEFLLNQI